MNACFSPRWTVHEWKTGLFIFLETDCSLQLLVSSSKKNIQWKAIQRDQWLLSRTLQPEAAISVVSNFSGYCETTTFAPLLKSMKDLGWVLVFLTSTIYRKSKKLIWLYALKSLDRPTAPTSGLLQLTLELVLIHGPCCLQHHYCLFSALTNNIST